MMQVEICSSVYITKNRWVITHPVLCGVKHQLERECKIENVYIMHIVMMVHTASGTVFS